MVAPLSQPYLSQCSVLRLPAPLTCSGCQHLSHTSARPKCSALFTLQSPAASRCAAAANVVWMKAQSETRAYSTTRLSLHDSLYTTLSASSLSQHHRASTLKATRGVPEMAQATLTAGLFRGYLGITGNHAKRT